MPFIEPMYAKVLKDHPITRGIYCGEEKFDGERMITSIAETGGNLFGDPSVIAWSRNAIPRILPAHIVKLLEKFPSCIIDGELCQPGKQSTSVKSVDGQSSLVLVVFDVLELLGKSTRAESYDRRREYLEEIFKSRGGDAVQLAASRKMDSLDQVMAWRDEVWARKGEGLMLKRRASIYQPGKRPKDWLKIKELKQGRGVLVGFKPGEMGTHSIMVGRDQDGTIFNMKTRNTVLRLDCEKNGALYLKNQRQFFFEYQHRTDKDGYRHPRFDRWVEPGE